MKISEIENKELRELAELRRKQSGLGYFDDTLDSFEWRDTKEGGHFWAGVDSGNITEIPKKENVNNASHNALAEIEISYALQDIAKDSRSPLHEVKEVYRSVNDLQLTKKVIKVADERKICPYVILLILKEFE